MTRLLLPAALALGVIARAEAEAPTAVRGTVTVKGVKTNADVVVTLEAPGLKLAPPAEPFEDRPEGLSGSSPTCSWCRRARRSVS